MPADRILKTLIALAASVTVMAGCSGTSSRQETLQPADHRPVQADRYPDFSKPLDSAMPQMSDQEAARIETQLSALARQRRSGAVSEAEYWRRVRELQALGRTTE